MPSVLLVVTLSAKFERGIFFDVAPNAPESTPAGWSSAEKEVAGAFRRIQQVRVGTVGRGKFGVVPSEGTISNQTSAERAEG